MWQIGSYQEEYNDYKDKEVGGSGNKTSVKTDEYYGDKVDSFDNSVNINNAASYHSFFNFFHSLQNGNFKPSVLENIPK